MTKIARQLEKKGGAKTAGKIYSCKNRISGV
jgi:hypothetical protein